MMSSGAIQYGVPTFTQSHTSSSNITIPSHTHHTLPRRVIVSQLHAETKVRNLHPSRVSTFRFARASTPHLDGAVAVHENVVALDVPVDTAAAVQISGTQSAANKFTVRDDSGVLQALAHFSANIRYQGLWNLKLCDEGGQAATVHVLHQDPTVGGRVRCSTGARSRRFRAGAALQVIAVEIGVDVLNHINVLSAQARQQPHAKPPPRTRAPASPAVPHQPDLIH
jgi:hypothetical protein